MRTLVFWFIIGYLSLGAILVTGNTGKPRKPYTPGLAVTMLVTTAALIAGIWYIHV